MEIIFNEYDDYNTFDEKRNLILVLFKNPSNTILVDLDNSGFSISFENYQESDDNFLELSNQGSINY